MTNLKNRPLSIILFLQFLVVVDGHASIPDPIAKVLNSLETNNPETKISLINQSYKEQSVEVAKSYAYPTLSLSGVYNNGSSISSTSLSNDLSQYSGGISGVSSPPTISQSVEGWTSNLSTNYFVFTGFLISDGIERAKRDLQASKFNSQAALLNQKSRYLQVLLEWQWLNEAKNLLTQADASIDKIRAHKKNVQFMYSEDDDLSFEEKRTYLAYQSTRVNEALKLAEDYLIKANPQQSLDDIKKIPPFSIAYTLPNESEIENKYKDQALSRKSFDLDVANAEGVKNVVSWQKPYIPTVMLTGGLSRSGTRAATSNETNWSAQLIFTFNFFDGFATQSRESQAGIGLQAAMKTRDLETDKKLLYLHHQIMKARVAQAEFEYKKILLKTKEIRFKDAQKKFESGIATQLELNLAGIDLAKAKMEGLEVLKDHQAASLSIATELNEWEKINVTLEKN